MKRGSAISVGLSVGISMSILFSVVFCKVLESYAGIGVGICFGIALGVLTFVMFRAYRKKKWEIAFRKKQAALKSSISLICGRTGWNMKQTCSLPGKSIEKDRRLSAENWRSFCNAYNRLTVLISFFRYQMLCANSSPLYSKMDKKIISEKSRLIEYVVQLIPDTMQWLTI